MEAGPLKQSPQSPPEPQQVQSPAPAASHPPPPVWVQRLLLVIEVGIALVLSAA
jgi:hypothetical protein